MHKTAKRTSSLHSNMVAECHSIPPPNHKLSISRSATMLKRGTEAHFEILFIYIRPQTFEHCFLHNHASDESFFSTFKRRNGGETDKEKFCHFHEFLWEIWKKWHFQSQSNQVFGWKCHHKILQTFISKKKKPGPRMLSFAPIAYKKKVILSMFSSHKADPNWISICFRIQILLIPRKS